MIPFFLVTASFLKKPGSPLLVAGLISCMGIVGVGLTPYDRCFVLHNMALLVWIGPMLIAMIAFSMAMVDQGRSRFLSTGMTLIITATALIYVLGDHSGRVVMQKVLAVFAVVWPGFVIQLMSFTIVATVSERNRLANQQATRYMAVLQKRYRK